jgi:O-6-methylguanine DNA methyltransferase
MIEVCAVKEGPSWFGVAHCGDELVATSVGATRDAVFADLERSIPASAHRRCLDEPSEVAACTAMMLAELESGNEEHKRFSLSSTYVPEPLRGVLVAAASIPLGYVSSYGSIAAAAGTEARVVGGFMASNPLYPIVPCHRVVGSDFSLVGYGRRQDMGALCAKLGRLRREARGYAEEVVVSGVGLRVYPVEWAIAKALRDGVDPARQLSLFP